MSRPRVGQYGYLWIVESSYCGEPFHPASYCSWQNWCYENAKVDLSIIKEKMPDKKIKWRIVCYKRIKPKKKKGTEPK